MWVAGFTTRMRGEADPFVIEARSAALYPIFELSAGFTEIEAGLAMSTVYPSGGDFATTSAAMDDPAPARFSITTGWPRARERYSLYARATVSAAPPGANPTTSLTGLFGYCADASAGDRASTAATSHFTCFLRPWGRRSSPGAHWIPCARGLRGAPRKDKRPR